MFQKFGESTAIGHGDIQSEESVSAYLSSDQINERFAKFAAQLKRVAPKSNEFLYFVSPMITSAEAAGFNKDGTPKKTRTGQDVVARFEGEGESMVWVTNDPSVQPYRNNNHDIFPEIEVIAAHKKWVGCPLLVDHRGGDVDAIRGIVLDTYYDRKARQVIGLCALDKVSYPDLARKIATRVQIDTSMGTAVKVAKCLDCGKCARSADQFCAHMRAKSGYGEVNIGLDPLELSIVGRGACSNAKIRTVFASAQAIRHELDAKESELSTVTSSTKFAELESDFRSLAHKFAELKESMTPEALVEDQNLVSDAAPYGVAGDVNPPTDQINQQEEQLNLPERLAHQNNQALIGEIQSLRASIASQLTNLEKTLQLKTEELNMATNDTNTKKAYWLGGGEGNEPTPGKPRYPIDPLNVQLREKEDRQQVGQPPFPDVGAVDGLHPSPSSVAEKDELARKKMLLRAERRAEALKTAKEQLESKKAYWLGGGEGNEPTPGKPKYPVDPLNEQARKEDKIMVGQSPFPDVGAVDGLHPSPASVSEKDELTRKKMLNRAHLKARFVRTANSDGTENLGTSGWHIYSKDATGEKLVLQASVDEISGGRAEALYEVIATKDFGQKMLAKVNSVGLSKAASLYKKSQAVAGPGALPGAPPDASGAGPAPAMDAAPPAGAAPESAPEAADEGGSGDPKETAQKLAEKNRDVASDLLEAVKDLTGEQSQMGEMEEGLSALPKAAASVLLPLHRTRVELRAELLSGMKKSLAELTEQNEEMALIGSILDTGSAADKAMTRSVTDEAFGDAKHAIADAETLMRSYMKYASGVARMIKHAAEAAVMADDVNEVSDTDEDTSTVSDSNEAHDFTFAPEMGHGHNLSEEDPEMHDEFMTPEGEGEAGKETPDMNATPDMNDVMVDVDPAQLPPGQKLAVKPASEQFDLTTKAGRSAFRAKIAADATGKMDSGALESAESIPTNGTVGDADKLADGGFLGRTLDTKPSDDLGRFETLPEQHKRMLEVARMPPKIRTACERINTLIAQGSLKASDVEGLVAKGLDAEVVKYWKSFWGQAGKEGSEFARLLTTETMKAKQAEEQGLYQAKIARAYELSYDMVRRGLLADDRQAIATHVQDVMQWNDAGFESMKRVIASHAPLSLRAQASMPQMGITGTGSIHTEAKALDLQEELNRAFGNSKPRGF